MLKRLAVLGMVMASALHAQERPLEPPFGRFIGVLRHESLGRDQLAKLDFIASREERNVLHLSAVLTLHFGGFDSGEYTAYHFDNVQYNILNQTFIFEQADQPVTLVARRFSGQEFEGEFRAAFGGGVSKLLLNKDKPAAPQLPLIGPVGGEYEGTCESKVASADVPARLQLVTYRSDETIGQAGNAFVSYRIRGIYGEKQGSGCISGVSPWCVWGSITSGNYNFYEGQLQVFNNYRNLTCSVETDGLKCDGCNLLKRVAGSSGKPALTPPVAQAVFASAPAGAALKGEDVNALQGKYTGYVHHEYLDRYQAASINLLAYQVPGEGGAPGVLRMSALARLSFGKEGSAETLSYKFAPRSYPNPFLAPHFVLQQTEGDVDAMIQVTQLGQGKIRGFWYSRLFGRVGAFEMQQGGPPALHKGAKLMEPVSGQYESTHWDLSLEVGQGTVSPNTENPFAPLTLNGWALMRNITPKILITGGSYDFYTGKIGFEVGENDARVGVRPSRRLLTLKKTRYASLAPLPEYAGDAFRLIGEPEDR